MLTSLMLLGISDPPLGIFVACLIWAIAWVIIKTLAPDRPIDLVLYVAISVGLILYLLRYV